MVLWIVFEPGHPARLSDDVRRRRSHGAEQPESQAELAGDEEGSLQLPVFRRLQDEGQPQPRHDRHHQQRADGDAASGQRVHERQAARSLEVRRRSRRQLEPVRVGKVRVLQHRLPADARGRHERERRPRSRDGHVVRLVQPEPQPAAAAHGQRRRELVPQRAARHARPEIRLRLPPHRGHDGHALAGRRHPVAAADGDAVVRADLPRGQRHQPRRVSRLLRRRHVLDREGDDQRWASATTASGARRCPSSTAANPAFPTVVPGLVFAGYDAPFTWNDVSPRVGVTYALDKARLDAPARELQPLRGTARDGYGRLREPHGDRGRGGLRLDRHQRRPSRVAERSEPESVRRDGRRLQPRQPDGGHVGERDRSEPQGADDEQLRPGVDRELRPNLAVQANYTYTRVSNLFGNLFANITPRSGVPASTATTRAAPASLARCRTARRTASRRTFRSRRSSRPAAADSSRRTSRATTPTTTASRSP